MTSQALSLADQTRRKPNKYGAKVTFVEGYRFHSKGEAKRWQDLRLLEAAGSISKLRRQVPFDLWAWGDAGKMKIGVYKADFVYLENGVEVVEDFKGCRTSHYARTKRIMKANHNIDIKETGK